MDVLFITDKKEAEKAISNGYTAVECAFGNDTLINDKKEPFDHHNIYSNLPSATVQAFKSNKATSKIVVNHIDFDSVMASALLLGKVSRGNKWIKDLIGIIDLVDRNGLGILTKDQKESPAGKMLLYFDTKTESLASSKANFMKALELVKSFEGGLTKEMEEEAVEFEKGRAEEAEKAVVKMKNGVLLVRGELRGFDLWYKKAPIVVIYNDAKKAISVGVINKAKAEELFGPGGLLNVFPKLGPSWGGREGIGGSPRGREMTFPEAEKAFETVLGLMPRPKKALVCISSFLRRFSR